jgi:hypothetical protein
VAAASSIAVTPTIEAKQGSSDKIPEEQIDRNSFIINKLIGEGQFGEVYEGAVVWNERIVPTAVRISCM